MFHDVILCTLLCLVRAKSTCLSTKIVVLFFIKNPYNKPLLHNINYYNNSPKITTYLLFVSMKLA